MTLPVAPGADRIVCLAVLVTVAVTGVWVLRSARPATPALVMAAGAVSAQTTYVIATGDADSPYLPGFMLIVIVVGVFSPPGRTAASAALAGVGLTVTALADQRLDAAELLTVVITFLALLAAGVTMSLLAWRRRVWVRRVARRAARARAAVQVRAAESRTDPLTGQANRRAFDEDLAVLLAAGRATDLALMFADVDDLKTVNDRLGHVAGDQMLRALADRFAGSLRARERVYRVGGDEFVAIVRAEDLEGLQARVGHRLTAEADSVGRVTASVGSIRGRAGDTADTIVRRADRAMYESKRRGAQQAG